MLPSDILVEVFKYLSPGDLINLTFTNTFFWKLLKSNDFWDKFFSLDDPLLPPWLPLKKYTCLLSRSQIFPQAKAFMDTTIILERCLQEKNWNLFYKLWKGESTRGLILSLTPFLEEQPILFEKLISSYHQGPYMRDIKTILDEAYILNKSPTFKKIFRKYSDRPFFSYSYFQPVVIRSPRDIPGYYLRSTTILDLIYSGDNLNLGKIISNFSHYDEFEFILGACTNGRKDLIYFAKYKGWLRVSSSLCFNYATPELKNILFFL